MTVFLGKDDDKTHFETKGNCKKTVHTKAAKMKKEIIRKINKKANATSTSKVVKTGIKRTSAVTTAGTASKRSKDDEEDEHDIDITVHSQKLVHKKMLKMLRKSKHLYRISFQKNDLKIKRHRVIVNIFHSTIQSIFHTFHY